MKLITTIVRPEVLPEVKAALFRAGITGITLRRVTQAPAISAGDTAWVLASSALVLLMTVGLACFYGGLVRSKNSLNTMMMSIVAMGAISVQWVVVGYSLSFAPGSGWLGGLDW